MSKWVIVRDIVILEENENGQDGATENVCVWDERASKQARKLKSPSGLLYFNWSSIVEINVYVSESLWLLKANGVKKCNRVRIEQQQQQNDKRKVKELIVIVIAQVIIALFFFLFFTVIIRHFIYSNVPSASYLFSHRFWVVSLFWTFLLFFF